MMDGLKLNHQEAEAIFNLLNTMIASRNVDRLNVVVVTGYPSQMLRMHYDRWMYMDGI